MLSLVPTPLNNTDAVKNGNGEKLLAAKSELLFLYYYFYREIISPDSHFANT